MARTKLQVSPPTRNRGVRLKTLRDIRRLLNKTINELRNGDTKVDIARAIIYACSVCLACFETEKLEALETRLSRLEIYTNGEEIQEYISTYSEN
jgi:hypothetical protein